MNHDHLPGHGEIAPDKNPDDLSSIVNQTFHCD
jgi:hypothetical protein